MSWEGNQLNYWFKFTLLFRRSKKIIKKLMKVKLMLRDEWVSSIKNFQWKISIKFLLLTQFEFSHPFVIFSHISIFYFHISTHSIRTACWCLAKSERKSSNCHGKKISLTLGGEKCNSKQQLESFIQAFIATLCFRGLNLNNENREYTQQ